MTDSRGTLRIIMPRGKAIACLLLIAIFCALGIAPVHAATFRVNLGVSLVFENIDEAEFDDAVPGDGVAEHSIGDGEAGLRTAIQEANALPGQDTILFTGAFTLMPRLEYPPLTDPAGVIIDGEKKIVIDGSVVGVRRRRFVDRLIADFATLDTNPTDGQLSFQEARVFLIDPTTNRPSLEPEDFAVIDLDGDGFITEAELDEYEEVERGLIIGGPNNVIANITIINFPQEGLVLSGANVTNTAVHGCQIGTTGTSDNGNLSHGIHIANGAHGNLIGGATAALGNVISGNGSNATDPINDAGGTQIGVTALDYGHGILIEGDGTENNLIQGNFIGTNATGTAPVGNAFAGIMIRDGAASNTIGGTNAGEGNVVSGNGDPSDGGPDYFGNGVASDYGMGIIITGSTTTDNLVLGNLIGTNAEGTGPVPNRQRGVYIRGQAFSNFIGGVEPGAGNTISGNGVGTQAAHTGLAIVGLGTAGNFVRGNKIGTNAAGTGRIGSQELGLYLYDGASVNIIGGTEAGAGNLISGNNSRGVVIAGNSFSGTFSSANILQGNFIGTDVTGQAAVPNINSGLSISDTATFNLIGGSAPGAGNLISGNVNDGLIIFGSDATNNIVQGNKIGTDSTGTRALPNTILGVFLNVGTSNNQIGGTAEGAGNLISGNGTDGLRIAGGSFNNTVEGNLIGTDITGTIGLGNTGSGVSIQEQAVDNIVGGLAAAARNIIASNKMYGVEMIDPETRRNGIRQNSIFMNEKQGIRVGFFAQEGIAPPELNSIGPVRGTTVPNAKVEIFVDSEDEGEIYLATGTADAAGNYSFEVDFTGYTGRNATATATDTAENTSEFSLPLALVAPTVTDGPLALSVVEGETFALGITAEGTAELRYQWEYSPDGVLFSEIPDGGNISGATSADLNGAAAMLTDAGIYRCRVMNAIGTAFSPAVELIVVPADLADARVTTLSDENDGGDARTIATIVARPGANGISLREIILAANNTPGANTITFAVSGIITPLTPLPLIADLSGGMTIDGAGTILIDGQGLPPDANGFRIISGNNTIAGMLIGNFPGSGVFISGADAVNNRVLGCIVGNDGVNPMPNGVHGVRIGPGSSGNTVGGLAFAERNILSGNTQFGVQIDGAGSNGNRVLGNFIGTSATGLDPLPNLVGGVSLRNGASGNEIGGSAIAARNVISANATSGIVIRGTGSDNNVVQGNYIGLDANGNPTLANAVHGVLVVGGPTGTLVGGTVAGARNVIAQNGADGVQINGAGTLLNSLRQNSIFGNGGLGISLVNGANAGIAPPTLPGIGSIQGTTVPNATIDIFADAENEGRTFLQSVTANAQGEFLVSANLVALNGQNLTATSTDPAGNTSPFSTPLPLVAPAVVQDPQDTRAVEGDPFSFSVLASGTEELTYQWQFAFAGGQFADLNDGGGISGSTSATLNFATSTLANTGEYRVIIDNGVGAPATSNDAMLTVIRADIAGAEVSTLNDVADADTRSVAHVIAYSGADGFISLREMIIASNNTPGANTIDFAVAGLIRIQSALPEISDTTGGATINGAGIVLDGAQIQGDVHGLRLTSAENSLIGMAIVRFPGDGVRISGPMATNNSIRGCFIGVNNGVAGNAGNGVLIENGAASNTIGGPTLGARNVISGNGGDGVLLAGAGTANNVVAGNYIGSDPTGSLDFGNSGNGLTLMDGAADNLIGGNLDGSGNLISGNNGDGVSIEGAGANGNAVEGNLIGTAETGVEPLGNGLNGVRIFDTASQNIIGGVTEDRGNLIANNGLDGVRVSDAGTDGNSIRMNIIRDNESLGIRTSGGANNSILPPVIETLGSVAGAATPNGVVEIYVNNPGGDEGEIFLDTVLADESGAFFSGVNLQAYVSDLLTATVTDTAGNTSQFSAPFVVDLEAPVITLLGPGLIILECNQGLYEEFGATAMDDVDGDLTRAIVRTILREGEPVTQVDNTSPATYTINYDVSDASGKPALTAARTVRIVDRIVPILTLVGQQDVTIECRDVYVDAGAVASDSCAGDLTPAIVTNNPVNTSIPNVYFVAYNVTDPSGNPAVTVQRTVRVLDTRPPAITLAGPDPVMATVFQPYVDPGASAVDACDTQLPVVSIDTSRVDTSRLGAYSVDFAVSDASGNAASATRSVEVVDNVKPVITLLGGATIVLECGALYAEPGFIAQDNYDGDITARVTVIGSVDATVPGTYRITYRVRDAQGNDANAVVRTVQVRDTIPPTLVRLGPSSVVLPCNSVYIDAGATAADACSGDLTASISVDNPVDTGQPGQYLVTYEVRDNAGNTGRITRSVRVAECPTPCETQCTGQPGEDIDNDGDGLSACVEACLGTSDNNPDSDFDGIPDAFENDHGLNPAVDDAFEDLDGDGISNIDEFLNGWLPENAGSPGRVYFVDANRGQDVANGGSAATPWASIGYALASVNPSAAGPVRLLLAPGVYPEDVFLKPWVTLAGSPFGVVSIEGTVYGAHQSGLEQLEIVGYTNADVLLDMNNVSMRVIAVTFRGAAAQPGPGILARGNAVADSLIEACLFSNLSIGIEIQDAVPLIRRCIFENLSLAGILVGGAAKVAGGNNLGDSQDAATGCNTFSDSIAGKAIVNLTGDPLMAQNNAWSSGDANAIRGTLEGSVDFSPFLNPGTGVDAAAIYVVVEDSRNQNRIGDAVVSLVDSGFNGVRRNNDGIYAFPCVAPGLYRVRIESFGYTSVEQDAFVGAGGLVSVIVQLDPAVKRALLGCSVSSAGIVSSTYAGDVAAMGAALLFLTLLAYRRRPNKVRDSV